MQLVLLVRLRVIPWLIRRDKGVVVAWASALVSSCCLAFDCLLEGHISIGAA
jgi:hypothetical protein